MTGCAVVVNTCRRLRLSVSDQREGEQDAEEARADSR